MEIEGGRTSDSSVLMGVTGVELETDRPGGTKLEEVVIRCRPADSRSVSDHDSIEAKRESISKRFPSPRAVERY